MSQEYNPRPYQQMLRDWDFEVPRNAKWAGMGLGKAQEDSEPVLTATGWLPIGTLQRGMFVYGADGTTTEVTGVFPQGAKEVFKILFNDGSWTRASADHLWRVFSANDRYSGKDGRVLTTSEIKASGIRHANGNSMWFIPLVQPIQRKALLLPVDPYLLGVILGDGHIAPSGCVTVMSDTAILVQYKGWLRESESFGMSTKNIAGIRPHMRALGLAGKRSWEKHCPLEYLHGSIAQRLALLQGLLDTDGSPMADGGVEFCSTSELLIDAAIELAESLGGVARNKTSRFTKHQGGVGRESWRINIKLPAAFKPFRLQRKLDKWVAPTKYPPARAIVSITPDGSEHCTCISVAAADHLYVTRRHIVTHNTAATLTSASELQMLDGEPRLVLAPLRVARSTWPNEVKKWNHTKHLRVSVITGSVKEREFALRQKADIYTTNYENLVWLTERLGEDWPFPHIIMDESTRLKSFRLRQGGKRAQALARVAHTKIKTVTQLTGTPAPNGLLDLWGQMWFLDAGHRLGRSYTAFKERWFRASYDGYGSEPMECAQAQIQAALKDICLTVDAKDWFDLKAPIVNNIYVDLPARTRAMYNDMEKELFMQIDEHGIEAFNAAAKTQKLLQLASGAVYLDKSVDDDGHPRSREWRQVHDEKLDALDEIIAEAAGAPVLVAYHFRSDLARLKARFKQGRELDADPQTEVEWNAGKIPILFAHPQSAGHGLNLQDGGNILVFFSHNWKLEDRLQIAERIGPMRQFQSGYDRPVFIHNIIARDTADEMVLERIETKREVQDILLTAMRRYGRI